jgi:sec-independent protein translocase protein TatA
MPGPFEVAVILAVLLLLFGAKRIPEIAKGFGAGIREFKRSIAPREEDPGEDRDGKNG